MHKPDPNQGDERRGKIRGGKDVARWKRGQGQYPTPEPDPSQGDEREGKKKGGGVRMMRRVVWGLDKHSPPGLLRSHMFPCMRMPGRFIRRG